ncbi:hypothetical protein L1987_38655 [Smallanthus sonchifolius]|uniref:Uncharacterized protein n=1 Tax=Smallanthus sonchifolius TaxID=185202 RepID=A0ACB9HJU7_9ASTR|nr:hypothetical protein L1987_38655 [Smallanthus sonchifolius]
MSLNYHHYPESQLDYDVEENFSVHCRGYFVGCSENAIIALSLNHRHHHRPWSSSPSRTTTSLGVSSLRLSRRRHAVRGPCGCDKGLQIEDREGALWHLWRDFEDP